MQVRSRTIAIQLEGSFVGSITAIEGIVVDKVGMYAYPLLRQSRRSSHQALRSFQNFLIVNVETERRTKTISVQTPYCLVNQSALALQFKVRRPHWCFPTPSHCCHPTVAFQRYPCIQVQVQTGQGQENARGRKAVGGQQLNPVLQLPMKGDSSRGSRPLLETGQKCFLPLTALAEYAETISLYIAAGERQDDRQRFQADCVELQSHSLTKQQGVYKCSTADGEHHLCLHVQHRPTQVCINL